MPFDIPAEKIQQIAVWALPVIFAITLHEAAHAWAAWKLGDATAKDEGRLSANPLRHIDPFGTIVLPLVLLWLGGFVFGWAKPVPVNWNNLNHPKRDIAWVALAGPGANVLMALAWALLYKIGLETESSASLFLLAVGQAGIAINVILAALNLLPLLPLDGGRVLYSLLPQSWASPFASLEPFGLIILLGLMFTGLLEPLMNPIITLLVQLIRVVYGL